MPKPNLENLSETAQEEIYSLVANYSSQDILAYMADCLEKVGEENGFVEEMEQLHKEAEAVRSTANQIGEFA